MKLDIGYIILCLNDNKSELKNTVDSILWSNNSKNCYGIVSNTIKDDSLKEICPIYKGSDTITSLINTGMKSLNNEWAFILYAGSRLKTNLQRKMSLFIKDSKDILFPIINGKSNFVDGSSNGIMVHKEHFASIGEFPIIKKNYESTLNDFEIAKLLWANDAIRHNSQFKAIAGIRLF